LSTAAVSLKSSFSDLPPWDGSNASGFSALPGGVRAGFDGCYYAGGYNCRFWVAEASNYYGALTHGFSSNLEEVDQVFLEETFGFSVRCIKD
jgi:uncharacterized protein (TIGR02145 family)